MKLLYVPLILAAVAATSSPPKSPVADAAMRADWGTVRSLVRQGADVNRAQGDGMTALHWAARHGSGDATILLLGAHASVNALTRVGAYTPLHIASEVGSATVVSALLKGGANARALTTTGLTPLHLAALAGSTGAVNALLDRGAPVNAKEPAWGQTPLMFAASRGRTDALRALLRRGADPAITATVVDLVGRVNEDRAAKARRNQVLDRKSTRLN